MKFSYTYRDKNGSLQNGVVEALNRAEAFTVLSRSNIRPLNLKEGGASGGLSSNKSRRPLILWGVIVAVVLGVGSILPFLLPHGDGTPPQDSTRPHTVKASTSKPVARPVPPKAVTTPEKPAKPQGQAQSKPNSTTAAPTNTPKKALTPEDEGYVSPDPTFAERYKRFKEEQAKLPFKHMSELEIHRIISTMPGETILPTALPPTFEEDFVKHMNDPIVINDDDSEETRQAKETMIAVKAKLKELMAKGESIREIVESEQEHLVKVMKLRDNLFAELRRVEDSAESLQEVDDYVKAANKILEEYGAQNIKLPMTPARFRLLKLEGKVRK